MHRRVRLSSPIPSVQREEGWGVIRNEPAEVLVVCIEELSSPIPSVPSDFAGTKKPLPKMRANVRLDRHSAELYRLVKQRLVLDRATREKIYAGRFVRHFYAEQSINRWIEKWTQPR